jgi:hypothetical protein
LIIDTNTLYQRGYNVINRQEYVRTMQTKLDTWSAEIETLSGNTGSATPEVRSSVSRQIGILNSKLAVAWMKIKLPPDAKRAD